MQIYLTRNQKKIKNFAMLLIFITLITIIFLLQNELYSLKHQSECASQEMIEQCINQNNKE